MAQQRAIGGLFPATRASVVEALRASDPERRERAIGTVIELYWRPLYKYLRIRWDSDPEDAQDLIQDFFAAALERDALARFDPSRASFRTFLRLLLDHHLSNHLRAQGRLKRGGASLTLDFADAEHELGQAHSSELDPEALLHREWVRSVFTLALEHFRSRLQTEQRSHLYDVFAAIDLADEASRPSYREVALRLGLAETTITNHLAAARRSFRAAVLDLLREVTATEDEFRAEARATLGFDP